MKFSGLDWRSHAFVSLANASYALDQVVVYSSLVSAFWNCRVPTLTLTKERKLGSDGESNQKIVLISWRMETL